MPSPSLPYLGLGIAANLGDGDLPDPFGLLDRVDFVEYSAPLDLDEAVTASERFGRLYAMRDRARLLFHPVHLDLWGPDYNSRAELEALARHLREVGSPWVSNDLGWWRRKGKPFPGFLFLPPLLIEESVEECAQHVRRLQRAVGVPVAVENPPYQAPIGTLHVLELMARVQEATGCELLLDVGHLYSHNLARGLPPDAGLDGFPLERVIEIHVAGGALSEISGRLFYTDDHTQALHGACLELLRRVVTRCVRLRALTYEADGQPESLVVRVLEELRALMPPSRKEPLTPLAPVGAAVELLEPVPVTGPALAAQELLFEVTHGVTARRELARDPEAFLEGRGLSGSARAAFASADPAGLEADAAYRAATIAHRIDRFYPWTRLLLLAAGDTPHGFAESEEFRQMFELKSLGLVGAFERYAGRFCRERSGLPGLEQPVVFEMWKQMRGPRHVPGRPPSLPASDSELSAVTLGVWPGAALRSFGVDLSEFRLAAERLMLTVSQRARALETTPMTARVLSPLLDVSARAPQRPWPLVLQRDGAGAVSFLLPTDAALLVLRMLLAQPSTVGELLERLAPPDDLSGAICSRIVSVVRGLGTSGLVGPAAAEAPGLDPMEAILGARWLAETGYSPLL